MIKSSVKKQIQKTVYKVEFVSIPFGKYRNELEAIDPYKNIDEFNSEIGLKYTYSHELNYLYIFQIVDEKRWMLAKIKHGF